MKANKKANNINNGISTKLIKRKTLHEGLRQALKKAEAIPDQPVALPVVALSA